MNDPEDKRRAKRRKTEGSEVEKIGHLVSRALQPRRFFERLQKRVEI